MERMWIEGDIVPRLVDLYNIHVFYLIQLVKYSTVPNVAQYN